MRGTIYARNGIPPSYTLSTDCLGALSMRSFVRLAVSQSVGLSISPSIGPFVGPSAGPSARWMHRCLLVSLVLLLTKTSSKAYFEGFTKHN